MKATLQRPPWEGNLRGRHEALNQEGLWWMYHTDRQANRPAGYSPRNSDKVRTWPPSRLTTR